MITLSGGSTAANNGTYKCISSTATTIELANPNGAAQSSGTLPTVSCGDTFKLALYTSSASLDKTTTAYTSSNEVGASGSYAAGGGALTNLNPLLSTDTACASFSSLSFTSATITARGALIYNASLAGKPSVLVLNFTTDQTSTNGTFTINFPTQSAGNAVLQLA